MVKGKLRNPFVASAVFCCLVIYSGLFRQPERNKFYSLIPENDICILRGKICSNPQKRGTRYFFSFSPDTARSGPGVISSCTGIIMVSVPADTAESYLPGKLFTKGRKTGVMLCEDGAHAILTGCLKQGIFIARSVTAAGWDQSSAGAIAHFRALCRLQFKRLMFSWGSAGGLLLSLLSSAREYTEKQTADGFRNAGLSHILALSGMHLSLVSGIVLFAGSRLFGKKRLYFLQAAAVSLFVWFAGASPSLTRALLCSLIMLSTALSGFVQADMFVILCIAFLCHTVIAPADIYTAAFMLSYGALAGILMTGKLLNAIFSKIFPPAISSSLASSVGAQLFTAPISFMLFGTWMPVGIAASPVISPLVTLFIYCGIVCMGVCALVPSLVPATAFLINIVYTFIKYGVLFFARIPGFTLSTL